MEILRGAEPGGSRAGYGLVERAFVAAGGLLLAGPDPVGIGGNIPGFGDQREIELLVDAGFTPVQAIRIATLNGAIFLGRQDQIGSIAASKNADLVVMKGDPATRIADIENVEIVFKDGVGYDTKKLLDSVKEARPTSERLSLLYEVIVPGMIRRYEQYVAETDALLDAPSVAIIERITTDLRRQIAEATRLRVQLGTSGPPIDTVREKERAIASVIA